MTRKPAIWAVIAMVVVIVATVVFLVMRSDDESNSHTDCDVMSVLFTEWSDTLAAAQQELVSSSDGREGALALADTEAELAGRIRAAKEDVESPHIAADLERWAAGAEQGPRPPRRDARGQNPQ